MPTAKIVAGTPREARIRRSRQMPARDPYSNIDSVRRSRTPARGWASTTSFDAASEVASPCSTFVSPPSSQLTTTLTAIRAPPGHCGCGGVAPYPARSRG
jgi:hypothetical protein